MDTFNNEINQEGKNEDSGKSIDCNSLNELHTNEGCVERRRSASVGSRALKDGTSKFFRDVRKHPRKEGEEDLESGASSEDEQPAQKVSTGKNGRGRTSSPALGRDARGRFVNTRVASVAEGLKNGNADEEQTGTTSQRLSLSKTKAMLNAADRKRRELLAEQDVVSLPVAARKAREQRSAWLAKIADEASPLAHDLFEQVLMNLTVITNVATKSTRLKGTFVKALKDSALAIKGAVEVLSKTSVSAETRKLAADNKRLKTEVTELRTELVALRADLQPVQEVSQSEPADLSANAPLDPELLRRSIIEAVGNLVTARLEGLEDRLLPEKRHRPPLAVDRQPESGTGVASYAVALKAPQSLQEVNLTTSEAKLAPEPSRPGTQQVAKGGREKGKKRRKEKTPTAIAQVPAKAPPPVTTEHSSEWTVVTRSKATKAECGSSANSLVVAKTLKTAKRMPKLRPPRLSAVVIKLQQNAAEKGVTYAGILKEAITEMDLEGLGLQSIRFRTAATGAKIIEVPGATSGEIAGQLAEWLWQVVGEGVAQVSRTEKCAVLRISGLDDAAEKEEVAETVAKHGECSVTSVKVREIRRDRSGLGTVIVSCPIGAASNVLKAGRILISWSSVRARLLPQRPLRCFRCLEVGHVREKCNAEVDRSNACFRCGQLGHISSNCSAAAYCLVCAASGKPTGHKVGSKACTSSGKPTNETQKSGAAGTVAQPTRPNATKAREEERRLWP